MSELELRFYEYEDYLHSFSERKKSWREDMGEIFAWLFFIFICLIAMSGIYICEALSFSWVKRIKR